MVALAYPLTHDPESPDDHGPYLVPDGGPARGGRRAGSAGGQPGNARPWSPARPTRPAGSRPADGVRRAQEPAPARSRTAPDTAPSAVFWRRRLFAAAGVALGAWLTAAALGGLTTALSGLESRPLTAPELAGAGQPATAAEPTAAPRAGQIYVVQPGETLWDIARRLQPSGDIRPLVDRLARAHGRGPLQIGEHLVLP
jgi:hypothetical protein